MTYHFSVIIPNLKDGNENPFQALGGKIRPLILNSPVTFVSESVRCSLALCLFLFKNLPNEFGRKIGSFQFRYLDDH